MKQLNTLVFSKNRACQLELLLRSLDRHATVLYACDLQYEQGYKKVITDYPKVQFVRQENFQQDLIKLVSSGPEYVLILVDDDVMVSPFSANSREFQEFKNDPEVLSLSLRMSPRYCRGGLPKINEHKINWEPFSRKSKDFIYMLRNWGCPMAVGGNIFRKVDILPAIQTATNLQTPNFLETVLVENVTHRPLMMCMDEARFVNVEANQVQLDFPSHTHGQSPAELEALFLAGGRIALEPIIDQAKVTKDYFLQTAYQVEKV